MKHFLHKVRPAARRLLVAGAGVLGLLVVTAGPAAAGLRNHAEPFTPAS